MRMETSLLSLWMEMECMASMLQLKWGNSTAKLSSKLLKPKYKTCSWRHIWVITTTLLISWDAFRGPQILQWIHNMLVNSPLYWEMQLLHCQLCLPNLTAKTLWTTSLDIFEQSFWNCLVTINIDNMKRSDLDCKKSGNDCTACQ